MGGLPLHDGKVILLSFVIDPSTARSAPDGSRQRGHLCSDLHDMMLEAVKKRFAASRVARALEYLGQWLSLHRGQKAIDRWIEECNEINSHSALKMASPRKFSRVKSH